MKRIWALLAVLCLLILPAGAADLSYTPATYNEWGEAVVGASGYQAVGTIDGNTLGVGAWLTPTDMTVSPDGGLLFVLDSGNNRVTVCDDSMRQVRVIDVFTDAAGNETRLNGATGIFYDGKELYIADKGNGRVICCDADGRIRRTLTKPESTLFPQEREFLPTRVLADSNGVVYVICEGVNQGAVIYAQDDTFLGYIGSNKIQTTVSVLFNNLIKRLVNEDAQDNMVKYTPVEFTNFTIDAEDFIYTCTNVQDVGEKIKKLNAGGVNIFAGKIRNSFQKGFGDIHPPFVNGATAHSRFVDVAVAKDGVFYGLDFTNMKIFVYNDNTDLLFTFGGPGTRNGLFLNPVAVDLMGDRVLVLDTAAGCITCFEQTEFGALVTEAMALYGRGRYEEAIRAWNDVLKYNSNYTMAYIGLGKAHLELNRTEEALDYFKTAHYEPGYNEAYRILRVEKMQSQAPAYFVVILLLLFVIYGRQIPPVGRLFRRLAEGCRRLVRRPGAQAKGSRGRRRTPFYTMLHPIEGYPEMRYNRWGSPLAATVCVCLLFVALFAKECLFGFAFRVHVNPDDLNLPLLLLLSVGLCVLFTAINWAICTLFDGSGQLRDIWVVVGYSLLPYVLCVFIACLLSRFLTSEEAVFIEALQVIGALYSGFLLIKGMEAYHEYSFGGAIVSVLCTLVGLVLLMLLGVLLFSIVQQFVAFAVTVYQEMLLRTR